MLLRLLLIFTVVPMVELALLIEVGRRIGTLSTLVLIVVTGVVGAALARREGLGVLRALRAELAAGQIPGPTLVDGVIILLAGALLVTPGILTDAVGFACLIPATRRTIRAFLWRAWRQAIEQGRARVVVRFDADQPRSAGSGRSAGASDRAPD